jgi:peptide/nickel transport system substrate-binding protein
MIGRGRRRAVAFAAIAILATAVSTFAAAGSVATAAPGYTFRLGVLHPAGSLDVATDATPLAAEIWKLQYPQLTSYDENDVTAVPGLADSWSASPDARTFVYHLRAGLLWSNGTPIKPSDVVASINNARTQHWPGTEGSLDDLTARVDGPQSVAVTTTHLDQRLPIVPVPIVPNGRTNLTVGSGPFVVEHRDATTIGMEANPHYWSDRGTLNGIVFQVYPNGNALTTALERGDIDALSGAPPAFANRLNDNETITTVSGNDGQYYAIALDTRTAPFSDVRIRRAFGLSIDRALLVQQTVNGVGRSAVTPTVARSPQWDFDKPTREALETRLDENPGEANALLQAAGVQRVDIALSVPPGDPLATQIGSKLSGVMQGDAFHVTVVPSNQANQANQASQANQANARIVLRVPADDPSTVLQSFTCAGSGGWWCNASYDQAFAKQASDIDPASRTDTVLAMKRALITAQPEVGLFHPDLLEAYRRDRWTDLIQQPKDTGPAFFTASAANFTIMTPAVKLGSDKISAQVTLLAILAVIAVAAAAIIAYFIVRSRARTRHDEPVPSAS